MSELDDLVSAGAINPKYAKILYKILKKSETSFSEVAIKNYENPDELFDITATYFVFKMRPFMDCIRNGKIIDIAAYVYFKIKGFNLNDQLYLRDIPKFPIIGCSSLVGGTWYGFRKKSNRFEAMPYGALMRRLKGHGYITVLPFINVPIPTLDVGPVDHSDVRDVIRYYIFY